MVTQFPGKVLIGAFKILGLILSISAAPLLFASNSFAETIRFGAILDLTGPYAAQGKEFMRGIEIAVDESSGKVELFVDDTGYSPRKAVTAANQMISQQLVSVLFLMTASETKSVGSIANRYKVLTASLWDSSPEIEAIGPLSFGFGPWGPASGERSAEFAYRDLSSETAAMICQNEEWSLHVCKSFANKFKTLGGKITIGQTLDPELVDFRTALSRVKYSKPELIFFPLARNASEFIKQLRTLNFDVKLLTADVLTDDDISRIGNAAESVYQLESRVAESDELIALKTKYKEKYKEECKLTQFLSWGYDAAKVIIAGWERSGHKSGPELAAEIKNTRLFRGTAGLISVNERGSSPKYPGAFRVKDGKLVPMAMSGYQ